MRLPWIQPPHNPVFHFPLPCTYMMRLLTVLFLLLCISASSQVIHCTVTDSAGQPLIYATVIFKTQRTVLYTNDEGKFSFSKDSVPAGDSISIGYVGFKIYTASVKNIPDNFIITMQPSSKELQPVIVSNCKKFKNTTVNREGRITTFTGPGPEMRMIIISHFTNSDDIHGYVKSISIYAGAFNENIKAPVRLHWYKWNSALQQPGEEITDRNLIIYPYHRGWNDFDLPENLFYYSRDGIVLGLEFIYPVDFVHEYKGLTSTQEKINWLQDMQHRWSLGMKTVTEIGSNSFYIINNEKMVPYKQTGEGRYLQPAIRFNVLVCKKS